MQVLEEPQHLQLHILIGLLALERRLQELLPQPIQPQLLPEKPSQLPGGQIDALRSHLRRQRPEATQEVSRPFARAALEVEVKLVPQLPFSIQSGLAIDAFQGLQQLVDAGEGVFLRNSNLLAFGVGCGHSSLVF